MAHTHQPSNKITRRVIADIGAVFPRRYRYLGNEDARNSVLHAKNDCKRDLLNVREVADPAAIEVRRKQVSALYEGAIDVLVNEINRYFGSLNQYLREVPCAK